MRVKMADRLQAAPLDKLGNTGFLCDFGKAPGCEILQVGVQQGIKGGIPETQPLQLQKQTVADVVRADAWRFQRAETRHAARYLLRMQMQELGNLLCGNVQKALRAERINQKLHAAPFGRRHGALVELAEQMVAKGRTIGERGVCLK